MKKNKQAHPPKGSAKPASSVPAPRQRFNLVWLGAAALGAAVIAGAVLWRKDAPSPSAKTSPAAAPPPVTGPVTFSKHIAPIVFNNCSPCHRPGQSGPFDLLTFADVQKRARQIVEVTGSKLMPPWLPEKGYGEFEGERRLSESDIALIQRWAAEGALEGNTNDLPPIPHWAGGWQLGEPDLVVETQPYTLAAEGRDIYYNFVVPIPAAQNRYVKGVEFLPGNYRAAHHAFVNIDETGNSRRLGAKLSPPGFIGMNLPETVMMPGGQLLGWQPGKMPRFTTQGLAWELRPDTDLVLQVHMNPSGKKEIVQPKVGFHFTDQPPTNTAFRVQLTALKLDIPAGQSNYVAEESYTLPVDLDMVAVGAHAHYLAKDIQGYALLPNGEKKWLLWIKDWDFKWQGDYLYKEPVALPKGSRMIMRITYDNSAANPRNPHHPPKRVLWGLETADEMGSIYFQALPRVREDYPVLSRHYGQYFFGLSLEYYRFRLSVNPADVEALQRLGRALGASGKIEEAVASLTEAIRLAPQNDLAYFDRAAIYQRQGKLNEAYADFLEVTRLNPGDSQAHGSLGILCLQTRRAEEAREHFRTALTVNPDDAIAAKYLKRLEEAARSR